MRIRVYMKDGRTCYRLAKRSQLGELLRAEPDGEKPSVTAEHAIWNPAAGLYSFGPVRLRYINKASISSIEEDPRS